LGLACKQGADIQVLLDEEQTLKGKAVDTPARVQQMLSAGIEVRTVLGVSIMEAYREVGRSVASHIKGAQHSKTVLVDEVLLVGSCNWTTASRSNFETGALIHLAPEEIEAAHGLFNSRWEQATVTTTETMRQALELRSSRSSGSSNRKLK
jgi:phosphatidylserine/phosphatidylglycerophosphate/cardiolipin synthase-like enzyme